MLRRIDFLLLGAMCGLLTIGLLFIYSSSIDITGNIQTSEFNRQLVFTILGLIIFVFMHFLTIGLYTEYKMIFYAAGIVLLLLTLLLGEVRNGAKSWLGVFGFGIQASEFMKIATIIYLAGLLSEREPNLDKFRNLLSYTGVVAVPMILILLQPDMGTALVYIPILLCIGFVYGVPAHRIFFVVGVGVTSIVMLIVSYYVNSYNSSADADVNFLAQRGYFIFLAIIIGLFFISYIGVRTGYFKKIFWGTCYMLSIVFFGSGLSLLASFVLKPYQLQRLLIFVNPENDPLGSGWHILQSQAAIGAGGIWGQGYLQGTQSKLEFLPQKSTDFIFSVVGEELGIMGTGFILLCYTFLIWRLVCIGMRITNKFIGLFCAGTIAMFFIHFIVNVGMTLGIMPITGIPLLLVSYGGSSLLTSMISLAIIHSFYYHSHNKGQYIVLN